MSDNFQWQTDDDGWQESWEPSQPEPKDETTQPKRYWPLFVGVTLIGLIMVVWVISQRANERIETVTDDRSADVLASLDLIQQAVDAQDQELFVTFLSGRDPNWTDQQEELLREGKLLDRSHFGLQLLSPQPVQTDVELDVDLLSATVWADYRYQTIAGEEVVLRQTAVYRPSADQRWLLAPPEDDFWGSRVKRGGGKLEIEYDKRDEEWVDRLSPDLQSLMDRACQQLELDCEVVEVRLSLSHQLYTLQNTGDLPVYYEPDRLALPSPTIFGTPTDEASYQQLLTFYGAWVVTHAVKQAINYDCCKHGLFYHVVMQKLLDDLDIKPWRVSPEMYRHLLTHSFDPSQLDGYWQRTMTSVAVDQAAVFALFDFLFAQNEAETDPLTLLVSLTNNMPYERWLIGVAPDGIDTEAFRAHLLQNAQFTTLTDLPNYQLRANCMLQGQSSDYVSLTLSDLNWQVEQTFVEESHVQIPSWSPETYVLYAWQEPTLTLNVAEGSFDVPLPVRSDYPQLLDETDPNQQFLFFNFSESGYQRVDLADCAAGSCASVPLVGRPQWSPNGNHTLLVQEPTELIFLSPTERINSRFYWQTPFYLGDNAGEAIEQLGTGAMVTWVDNETYLFVEEDEKAVTSLMLGNLTTGEQKELVSAVALQTAVAEQFAHSRANIPPVITQIQQNPTNPRDLLLYASSSTLQSDLHLFRLTIEDETATWKHLFTSLRSQSGEWSPNGRYLALYLQNTRIKTVHLYDLNNMILLQEYVVPFDWGNSFWLPQEDASQPSWFFTQHDKYFLLTQPETNEMMHIDNPYDVCLNYEWLTSPP